jgi:2-polyprenyl-3-methyl-5-hydroxy-6-metoxy-1,4-benzoquinol methylase
MSEFEHYDFEEAMQYWENAPSGLGKLSSRDMLRMSTSQFAESWKTHYLSRKFHYWEEQRFQNRLRAFFAGKKVLSFGSGLGFMELEFVESGADLTCADIVQSNLDVIERAAIELSLPIPRLVGLGGQGEDNYGDEFDCIFVNGSLMTMPNHLQAKTLANFREHLATNGYIFLMLYTRRFAELFEAVDNPKKFARFSDPDVGELGNPWSDWHDEQKIVDLAGSELSLLSTTEWNDGLYAWSVLSPSGANSVQDPLAGCLDAEVGISGTRYDLSLADIRYHDAPTEAASPLIFEVQDSKYEYICQLEMPKLEANSRTAYEVILECEVESGGVAVNLYNSATDSILFARGFSQQGKSEFRVLVSGTVCTQADSLILSAFNPDAPSETRFVLRAISLCEIPSGEIRCLVT